MIIAAIFLTLLFNIGYFLLTILPILHFFHDLVIIQVIVVCVLTAMVMNEMVEKGGSKTGPEHLHNGKTFQNNGHQLLATHKEGPDRTVRTYAAPDGQIVTTITDTYRTEGNGHTVFSATALVLGVYVLLKLFVL